MRSLRFSSDGAFLAAAEPADFVHVYDVNASFTKKQTLDHFGETAGVSFSPCGEALFVGVADLTYGSVLEFERSRWGARRGRHSVRGRRERRDVLTSNIVIDAFSRVARRRRSSARKVNLAKHRRHT